MLSDQVPRLAVRMCRDKSPSVVDLTRTVHPRQTISRLPRRRFRPLTVFTLEKSTDKGLSLGAQKKLGFFSSVSVDEKKWLDKNRTWDPCGNLCRKKSTKKSDKRNIFVESHIFPMLRHHSTVFETGHACPSSSEIDRAHLLDLLATSDGTIMARRAQCIRPSLRKMSKRRSAVTIGAPHTPPVIYSGALRMSRLTWTPEVGGSAPDWVSHLGQTIFNFTTSPRRQDPPERDLDNEDWWEECFG